MKKSHVLAQTAATENIVASNMSQLLDLPVVEPVKASWEIIPPEKKMGRPPGTPNKLSAKTILDAIEVKDGQTFAEGFADDYLAARAGPDRHLLVKYQTLILNKVLADKVDVEVIDHARIIEAKADAFKAALAHLSSKQAGVDDNK